MDQTLFFKARYNAPTLDASNGKTDGIVVGSHGASAGKNAVAIGHGVVAPDGRFVVLDQDLTDVNSRLGALEKIVATQQTIIDALWYHPGMPGAGEAVASFASNSLANDKLK